MGKALVLLDTDHIKRYVFPTDKLKEIRGASSILDRLNRQAMINIAHKVDLQAVEVYANGGAGLFVLDSEENAEKFGCRVQQEFSTETGGGASLTFAIQTLPEEANAAIWNYPLKDQFELLRYRLLAKKGCLPELSVLPSHSFMRPCDSCGTRYVEPLRPNVAKERDPDEQDKRFCDVCMKKREEDLAIKLQVKQYIREHKEHPEETSSPEGRPLWKRIIYLLSEEYFPADGNVERPRSVNELEGLSGAKDYIALIYADGNGMGQKIDHLETLGEVRDFAHAIDNAIYKSVAFAISKHLRPEERKAKYKRSEDDAPYIFPFDILMIGGDDVMMVTPASAAADVALTIAEKFREFAQTRDEDGKVQIHTLSVGVVMAPINYPFGLLHDFAESTLKFAKMAGTKAQQARANGAEVDTTRINFMVVAGSSHDFKRTYDTVYSAKDRAKTEFYATLRPYNTPEFRRLLEAIREGQKLNLGRSKLHQVREAVLKRNLTTSVSDGMAVLRNWREKQRRHVVEQVYEFGGRYQMPRSDPRDPASGFPCVTFPWFADGTNAQGKPVYRTPLLDFVELYDFVAREETADER